MKVFLDRVTLYNGDCLAVLDGLPEACVDSVVSDPPYHLTSIVKRFSGKNAAPAQFGTDGAFARASRGFMGKEWDGGDVAFRPETWAKVWRVLKPGGHLLAFSATRTYHRMAVAIEDAGFEVRDQIGWAYGSGFPKSHDVSKAIDRAAGAQRSVLGVKTNFGATKISDGKKAFGDYAGSWEISAPATDAARAWEGWGTALKPAWEPIVVARKPLAGTVAENVLAHGTGALNIGDCRIGEDGGTRKAAPEKRPSVNAFGNGLNGGGVELIDAGRWPANIIHDGGEEAVKLFGEAARFFYSAKADADDRIGSKHPTVKPVDLMRYLVRLVTPKGGTVLDPFAGSGTTGEAAFLEGCKAILIEREAEYAADIERRMSLILTGPEEKARKLTAARPADDLPLFGGGA